MFTAKDMDGFVKKTGECPNIDSWLENSLSVQFKAGKSSAYVADSIISANKWTFKGFEYAMGIRGFIESYSDYTYLVLVKEGARNGVKRINKTGHNVYV